MLFDNYFPTEDLWDMIFLKTIFVCVYLQL
jgi:hypothetical protein